MTRAQRTESKSKKGQSPGLRSRKHLILAVVTLVLIVGFLLIWSLYHNTSISNQDKEQLYSKLGSLRSSINLPGELIYDKLQDAGCSSDAVGLQVSYSCGYSGYKLYKNNKDVAGDLREAKAQVLGLGFEELLANKRYHNNGDKILLDLLSYGAGVRDIDYTIKDLIDNGKLAAPANGEYIYGFRIGATYASCTNESFFKQPCPQPPSEPK